MERHTGVWVAYFMGFSLTLLFKWLKAVYLGRKEGKTTREVTIEWLFEPSLANGSSWTATVGGVWLLGSIYINRIIDISGLSSLPIDAGVAFFLGAVFEFMVPGLIKWIAEKVPSSKN